MREWVYKERKSVKVYIVSIVIVGEFLLFAFACLTIYFNVVDSRNLDFVYLLIIILSVFIWLILGVYAISNAASALTLRADVLKIEWSITRVAVYPWSSVKLHKIGLNKIPIIVAYDEKYRLLKHSLPRWVLIDGSSKQYKEMIGIIEYIKSGVQE